MKSLLFILSYVKVSIFKMLPSVFIIIYIIFLIVINFRNYKIKNQLELFEYSISPMIEKHQITNNSEEVFHNSLYNFYKYHASLLMENYLLQI